MNHYLKSQRSQCYCVACSYDSQHSLQIETFVLGRREIRSLWYRKGHLSGKKKAWKILQAPSQQCRREKRVTGVETLSTKAQKERCGDQEAVCKLSRTSGLGF